MKIEVKEPQTWQRIFEIEISGEQVKETIEELYRDYGQAINIPGFRPGRVPRTILEARFGKSIEAEAIERLVPQSLEQALMQNRLVPINRAQISDLDLSPEKVLRFKATFEVLPPVNIQRYKGIPAVKRVLRITEERVERELEGLRQLLAEYHPVERPAQDGDRVMVDYRPLADFPGGDKFVGRDHPVDLGSPQVVAEFNQGLKGARAGEEKEIVVQYPDDHPLPQAAGQKIGFRVSVKQVLEKKLPNLDDDLARRISEYQTLEELRGRIKNGLESQAEVEARQRMKDQIVNVIIQENPLELPRSLVEHDLNRMLEEAKERHRRSHRHPAGESCPQCQLDEEKMASQLRPVVEWHIRQDLILSQVAKLEGIQAEPQEVEAAVRDLARRQGSDPLKLMDLLQGEPERMEDLKERIAMAKAAERLVEWAEVKVEIKDEEGEK